MMNEGRQVVEALLAAGWKEEGRGPGGLLRFTWPETGTSIVVPTDPSDPQYDVRLNTAYALLEHIEAQGKAATKVFESL